MNLKKFITFEPVGRFWWFLVHWTRVNPVLSLIPVSLSETRISFWLNKVSKALDFEALQFNFNLIRLTILTSWIRHKSVSIQSEGIICLRIIATTISCAQAWMMLACLNNLKFYYQITIWVDLPILLTKLSYCYHS